MDSSSCSDAPSSEEEEEEGTPSVEAVLWSFHPQSRSCLGTKARHHSIGVNSMPGRKRHQKISTRTLVNTNLACQRKYHFHSNLANKKSCNKYAPSSVTRRCPNRSCSSPRHGSSKRRRQGSWRTIRILFKLLAARAFRAPLTLSPHTTSSV